MPPAPTIERKCSSVASGSCRCSIVCRKTTASAGSPNSSTSARSKRRLSRLTLPASGVAQPRVLEGLGVGLDADHARGGAREDVRAVALAARHVDHALAPHALGDPLVDDEMAPVPVVLLGDVGERPLAGQGERRHALGLVALHVGARRWLLRRRMRLRSRGRLAAGGEAGRASIWCRARAASAPSRSATRTPATTTWRRSTTTHKWGIDFGEVGTCAGAREGPQGARRASRRAGTARSRSAPAPATSRLNLLLAGMIGEATCSDISPGMLRTLRANAERLGLEVATAPADAERLPFEDASFDLVLGHAVLHHIPDLPRAFREFERVLAPGGTLVFAGEPSRYGDRLARVPKRVASAVAPAWRLAMRAPAARHESERGARRGAGARRRRARLRARRTRRAPRARPASRTCASPARSWSRTGSAGPTARSRRRPTRTGCRGPGASTPTAATSCSRSSTAGCSSGRLPPAIFYNLMITARKRGERLSGRRS